MRTTELAAVAEALARSGCIAPDEEAGLLAATAGDDSILLRTLVERRSSGEPLAWITGATTFCGEAVQIDPGIYVPRPQTESMARAAVDLLPADGVAVDLCTGSGAVAVVLSAHRPGARVLGTDIDPAAVRCARSNGVDAITSDMADALPAEILGGVDLVTAVVPYVPTEAIRLLPRDVQTHEPRLALDGGDHGTALLVRAAEAATRLLKPGGWLLVELGADQDQLLQPTWERLGFTDIQSERDEAGDLRAVHARAPRQHGDAVSR